MARTITTPKAFFVNERNDAYDNWVESFFREFFQNSVDSGARNIRVSIQEVPAKGSPSTGREPSVERSTRVVFEDDGCGMGERVLEDVFFALGASTKRDGGGSVGGFGRARIMQAFSQVRYAIRTLDRHVEGDGASYENWPVAEAAARLGAWASDMAARASGTDDEETRHALLEASRLHAADAAMLRDGPAVFKGCRFEVDLDPRDGASQDKRPTVERMRKALDRYLELSDIPCRLYLDGERVVGKPRRTEVRKVLAATMGRHELPAFAKDDPAVEVMDRPDGRVDVVFGTLRSIRDADARDGEKSHVNVRVRGATMFMRYAGADGHALQLDLVPQLSREVLTSNRDALRMPYRDALDNFTKLMATDARKALEAANEREFTLLQGGKGHRTGRRAVVDPAAPVSIGEGASTRLQVLEREVKGGTKYVRFRAYEWDGVVRKGLDGIDPKDVLDTLAGLRSSAFAGSFLTGFEDEQSARSFHLTLQRSGEISALEEASGRLLGFLCDHMRLKRAVVDEQEVDSYRSKMSDLHDTPILRQDLTPGADDYTDKERTARRSQLVRAARRYDPRGWDVATGKGLQPRKLLVAWAAAVDNCVDALHEAFPHVRTFPYSAGWTFSHQKREYDPVTRRSGWTNARAKYLRPDERSQTRYFLLNPLDDETFKATFNPRDPDSRARLVALAAHEVAHAVAEDSHDEAFARVLTTLMEVTGRPSVQRRMNKEMTDAMRAVEYLYSAGRNKGVPLDDEEGVRPADRLFSLCEAEPIPGMTRDLEVYSDGMEDDMEDLRHTSMAM